MPPEEIIPAAAETPAVTEAVHVAEPAAEGAAPEATFSPHTDTPTLLEGATTEAPKEEAVVVVEEASKPEPTTEKPTEKTAEVTPEAPRTYEAFTLPEGIDAPPEKIAAFSEIASKHNLDQETAQGLLDMHTSTLKAYADSLAAEQHRVFAETRHGWVKQIKADPELGGAGHQTAMQAVARMRDKLVPTKHQEEFNQFLRVTGAGDHPAFMRILHSAARYFDEPAAPPIPAVPVPDRGGSGKGSFKATMYDHPTSRRAAGR